MHEFCEFPWLIGTNPKLEVLRVRWLPSHFSITAMEFYMAGVGCWLFKELIPAVTTESRSLTRVPRRIYPPTSGPLAPFNRWNALS
jgi:hypothetical protein